MTPATKPVIDPPYAPAPGHLHFPKWQDIWEDDPGTNVFHLPHQGSIVFLDPT